jgi:hypothetical protein
MNETDKNKKEKIRRLQKKEVDNEKVEIDINRLRNAKVESKNEKNTQKRNVIAVRPVYAWIFDDDDLPKIDDRVK